MTSITQKEIEPGILNIILNRPEKGNALNENMIARLINVLEREQDNAETRVIIISGNGKHFCTGADLAYMQQMIDYSVEENINDALRLGKLFQTLYEFPKPTIAMIHGATYGGGLGLIAANDIAISSEDATFCFSEVRLGLVPSTISPYVINAIGPRQTKRLFLSAERFTADTALQIALVHHVVKQDVLRNTAVSLAQDIIQHGTEALQQSKQLVNDIVPIDQATQQLTAELIATSRTSPEAQTRLRAFLAKKSD